MIVPDSARFLLPSINGPFRGKADIPSTILDVRNDPKAHILVRRVAA